MHVHVNMYVMDMCVRVLVIVVKCTELEDVLVR